MSGLFDVSPSPGRAQHDKHGLESSGHRGQTEWACRREPARVSPGELGAEDAEEAPGYPCSSSVWRMLALILGDKKDGAHMDKDVRN